MNSPLTFPQEAHCWTRRYEQLREQVLAGDNFIPTNHRGLTVLITKGMAGWMRAWHKPLTGLVAAAAPKVELLPMSPRESYQQEATRLLVNMTLSHLSRRAFNS